MPYKIMIMGASYGSLLASKILFGGHSVHLICLPAEADLINSEGFRVRLPIRGRKDPVLLESRKLPGKVTAGGTTSANPADYDLIGLAMQEPQYRSPGVRELLDAVAKSGKPCMSIMNMPPLPYMRRIPGLNGDSLKPAYTEASVWDNFDPERMTRRTSTPRVSIRPKARPSCQSSSRSMTRFSCHSPNGRCCSPATIAASPRTACGPPRRPYTAISRPRVRSTISSTICA